MINLHNLELLHKRKQMMETAHRKLAAIVFTDMVGYTALMQQDEERAMELRKKHREVLQLMHEQYEGEILQYFGDGTLSIFESAVHAVECAIEIQQRMSKDPAVPLRIGIHLGDISYTGEGVYGDGVNVASRIESFSVPGAVLISDTVFEQIRNHPKFKTVSLGTFLLKNIKRPTQIYAMEDQGISVPTSDELLGKGKQLDSGKSNLPQQITSFIGRHHEIQEILSLIRQSRLVTLTGPGGTGKTRLALTVAERMMDDAIEKLYWISLAPVSDPESVILTIATTLSVVQDPSQNTVDLVIEFLQNKESFLILDNFEQVLNAVPVVQQILINCSGVKILVTSRTSLNLQGEREYPLKPLPLPKLNGRQDLMQLKDFPSINLFYERAKAVRPGFILDEKNIADVALICHRLDGLPLAIELAAARIKLFSPAALLKRLDQRLDLLKANNPDRPERHHTLRQTINWSYELLSADEQTLFQRLSVFSGGCNLEAIESICCGKDIDPNDIIDQMFALVNKSLINQEEDILGEPRFRMLETIRTFAREMFEQKDELYEISRAHAIFFTEKAEKTAPQLTGSEQSYWIPIVEEDLDNFKTAINWSIDHKEFELAFRLGTALWRFWINRGLLTEGVGLAHRLLELQVPNEHLHMRVKIAEGLSATYFYTGEYFKAVPICEDNLVFWRNADDEREIANNLNHLGFACINSGAVDEGIKHSQEALAMHELRGDLRSQAVSYNNIGWAYINAGLPQKACLHLEKSLELRKECNDERGVGFALVNLARAYGIMGKGDEALMLVGEGLEILEKNKDKIVFFWGILIKAQICYDLDKREKLHDLLEHNRALILTVSLAFTLNGWVNFLNGLLANHNGQYEVADHWIQKGINVFQERRMYYFTGKGWYYRSITALNAGNLTQAWKYLINSLNINHQYNNALGLAENIEMGGVLQANVDEMENAGILLYKTVGLRTELQAPVPPVLKDLVSSAWARVKAEIGPGKLEATRKKAGSMDRDQVLSLIK